MAASKTRRKASKGSTQGGGSGKGRSSSTRQGRSVLHRLQESWLRLLDADAVWVVLLLLVGGWCLAPGSLFGPSLEEGEIASRDFLAPRDILVPDEETTEEHRQRARQSVLPVYDYDTSVTATLDEQLALLFVEGREFLSYASEEQRQSENLLEELLVAVESASSVRIEPQQLKLLQQRDFAADVEDRVRALVVATMRPGVVDNKPLLLENRLQGVTLRDLQSSEERLELDLYDFRAYPDEVREYLDAELGRWRGWSSSQRRMIGDLLLTNIRPNVYFDRSETVARRDAAAAAEEPVFKQIREGQVVVRKGDLIDATAVQVWNEMEGGRRRTSDLLPLLGNALLLILVALTLWLALIKEKRPHGSVRPSLGSLVLLLILSLLAAKFGLFLAGVLSEAETSPIKSQLTYAHGIPFAALALVTSLLYGRATALVVAVLFSVLVGRLYEDQALWAVVYCLAGSLAAIYSLDKLKERSAVTRAGLVVAMANMATSLMLTAVTAESAIEPSRVGFELLCSFAGGLLVAATTSFVVPVLESLLSVTTDIKLIELSDTNLPLLRRLAFEAPGTFQHSLMVANLAKVGCEAIGDNPVLAYTGGLYHDVGKVFRPDYFVENQRGGQNRHDKLSPSMSSLIVISHVKDGVKLAEQHRLPRPILDAIEQHHGNRVLTFFFKRAEELAREEGEEVSKSDYRYPGPKPQSKVMGVLMYADAVEAASRTLVDPSPAKLRSVLRAILDDCLQDGQLDETDLTLSDLRLVSEAFLRVLETTYHKRVDYPGFDFNRSSQQKALRVVDGGRG